jgi:hypothetical protein
MRGQVCNLPCNEASSSYIATDGLSASSFGAGPPMGPMTRFDEFSLLDNYFLLGVGLPRPYPAQSQSQVSVGQNF